MDDYLSDLLHKMNPWLKGGNPVVDASLYIERFNADTLGLSDWDNLWLVLIGPRQAGKTTLGLHIANTLVGEGRFDGLIYLNCDFVEIRDWLKGPLFIDEIKEQFNYSNPVIFIDEVQRLASPGLLLKQIIDLKPQCKLIASGSSQLEIKSTVQEHLTGRQLESVILPLSSGEIGQVALENIIYGCYPGVHLSAKKDVVLNQLYETYINKDIIEILQMTKPDVIQKLIGLLAHSSGQLVNYQQLATDCRVSVPTIQNYCRILESTFVVFRVTPFVGNKRKEIVSNPIFYFVDNGFRNRALKNLELSENRSDMGLLVENFVLQELMKYKLQNFKTFNIHFWRTQSKAEVDFVIQKDAKTVIPIEVKYRNTQTNELTRSYHSFLDAYKPKMGVFITESYNGEMQVNDTKVHFVSLRNIHRVFELIDA